jgi:hypothetical protein
MVITGLVSRVTYCIALPAAYALLLCIAIEQISGLQLLDLLGLRKHGLD